MILSGDINLRHELWIDAKENLTDKFIFPRLVDLFVVCCAIGISDDKIIEHNIKAEEAPSIPRVTYLTKNEDLNTIITFMFQNAILTSNLIDYDNKTRLRLAFDPDFTLSDFSATSFLAKFATYGLSVIKGLENDNQLVYIKNIHDYIDSKSINDLGIDLNDDLLNLIS